MHFSLEEIAKAVGIQPQGLTGISYSATELVIPLNDEYGLLFREGDDDSDHEVAIRKLNMMNPEHKDNKINYE